MSYTIVGPGDRISVPNVADAEYSPMNPDGAPYRYCLMLPNGEDLAYGDTVDDLVDALVPGHAASTDETDKAEARILYAINVATMLQGMILANADPNLLDDYVWATLTAPKSGPTAGRADWWTSPIPFIAVETTYFPYTDIPRPASSEDGTSPENMWWIRPSTPEDLVFSLHEVGHVRLLENIDIDPALW